MMILFIRAFGGLVFLLVAMAATLFLSSGSWNYMEAWVFLAVFGICVAAITLYLAIEDPMLLERRARVGPAAEQQTSQKVIQLFGSVVFLGFFIIPGLDRRFGWSSLSTVAVICGNVLVVLGLLVVFLTFRANTFASVTIEVERSQTLVTTGPYGFVRHPMYAGALLMLVGVPLALRSLWGLIVVPPMVVIIAVRLISEERLLTRTLAGYAAYSLRVRNRLIPGVW